VFVEAQLSTWPQDSVDLGEGVRGFATEHSTSEATAASRLAVSAGNWSASPATTVTGTGTVRVAYQRSSESEVRTIAYDIALTQQGQSDILHHWPDQWKLPATATAMAMDGRRPASGGMTMTMTISAGSWLAVSHR
jgi:hypothetical protein